MDAGWRLFDVNLLQDECEAFLAYWFHILISKDFYEAHFYRSNRRIGSMLSIMNKNSDRWYGHFSGIYIQYFFNLAFTIKSLVLRDISLTWMLEFSLFILFSRGLTGIKSSSKIIDEALLENFYHQGEKLCGYNNSN